MGGIIVKENRSTLKKPAPLPRPPQIPQDRARAQTRAATVKKIEKMQ
jgi:hypothetical protein